MIQPGLIALKLSIGFTKMEKGSTDREASKNVSFRLNQSSTKFLKSYNKKFKKEEKKHLFICKT